MNMSKLALTLLSTTLLLGTTLLAEGKYRPLSNVELLENLVDVESEVSGFLPVSFQKSLKNGRFYINHLYRHDPIYLLEDNFNAFCSNFTTTSEYSIPPIIHVIWMGSAPTEGVKLTIASWRKYHPDWEIRLWTDEEVEKFSWVFPRSKIYFDQANSWAEKADILRLEILYQFGGIYTDADQVCLKPLHDLASCGLTFFAGIINPNGSKIKGMPMIGSGVIGSTSHHPILKRTIEFSKTAAEAPRTKIYIRGGNGALTKACHEAFLQGEVENILILPCSYFYSLPCVKRRVSHIECLTDYIKPESFAIHLWEASWKG